MEYLKQRMTVQAVEQESPTTFLAQLTERMAIDGASPHALLECTVSLIHAAMTWE